MATSITETGGSSTATETGNLEMSTKSNIIPEILPASEVLPTSEMGSSSTANEDESLVIDIRTMFDRTRQAISVGGGGLGMISVPDHLRKLDEQAFTPQLISIGPIHLSNVKLQSTKRYKVQFCESFLRWTKMDLKDLVGCVRSYEEEIRSYYAETITSSISREDFVTMILVDATFILAYFYKTSYLSSELDDTIPDWMHPFLKLDMVLLENQLPFSVLERLFKKATAELKTEPLLELATEFFQCYNFQKISPEKITVRIENFTDLVRMFHRNVGDLPKRGSGRAKLPYSATQLHEAGVKFKGVKFDTKKKCYGGDRHFLDLRFDLNNGVLEIPCITLNAEKIRLIRNISALEQSLYVGHAYVTDFFVILDFLIDTSKDIELLCDEGILVNYLGDSNAAASAINKLNANILWDYMNSEYSKICEDLNIFYKKPWHRWRATLWRQYFSTPWRAASTSAAIILLLLTAIQSVSSVKSTKW